MKILVHCKNCGKEIYKSKSDIDASKSGNVFCSKTCFAIYNNSHREFKQDWKDKISRLCSRKRLKFLPLRFSHYFETQFLRNFVPKISLHTVSLKL